MSARQAEEWADRAFLALAHSAIELPPEIERGGMAGIAELARLVGNVKFPELAPLMQELLACAQYVPDPSQRGPNGQTFTRPVDRDDDAIEEVATRQQLRQEIMGLHVNFSLAAVVLNLIATASEMRMTLPSESTSTSP
jgi:hypothetical protein